MIFKKISIVIPCYNEKTTIEKIIGLLKSAPMHGLEKEIIVVDDGSKDGTRDIVKMIPGIRYIFHEKNLGKGGAVKTGFREATGDLLMIQDADLEYDPYEIADVIKPVLDGETEMTLGVRLTPDKDGRRGKSLYWLALFGNHLITFVTNVLYRNNAGEYEGCYKAFSKQLVSSIEVKTNDFDFDNELVCKALKLGYKSVDVPIHYYPRNYDAGKKIGWKHGFKILWTVVRIRFTQN